MSRRRTRRTEPWWRKLRPMWLLLVLFTACAPGEGEPPADEAASEPHADAPDGSRLVVLDEDAVRRAGIAVAAAAPARIVETVPLRGQLSPDEDTLSHLTPRLPGVVREVRKRLGDPVARGEVLAVIEANQSLHPYEVRAALPGTVIRKDVTPGEFVTEDRLLFTVADLRRVWADLDVYREDLPALRVGQPLRLYAGPGTAPIDTVLSYLAPVGASSSQTTLARAEIANPDGRLRPGLFVRADVVTGDAEVPVAVPLPAIQELGGETVVFVRVDGGFAVRPVETGRRDAERIEIRSGLEAGEEVATTQSFVLVSELEKPAEHH